MTDPTPAREGRDTISETMQSTERVLRHAGRDFLVSLYTTLRSLKLYPIENDAVQHALDDLANSARTLLRIEDQLEVRISGEFIFVNSTRLRLELDNYASFSHVLSTLVQCGVGVVQVDEAIERREWQVFVSLLLTFSTRESTPNKLVELQQKMLQGGVTHIMVDAPGESDDNYDDAERAKEVAKRTYERSVAVTKEVVNSVRMGRSASVKRVKRAVQGIVDQVLSNEVSLVGLTTIRDYDEYTFTHSVNVCIFSVAIGKRLGLTRLQLYDLGMAALFHDVGKSRVPIEVLSKTGALDEDEWRIMQSHPWLGVLTLFGLRGYGEIPYRGMIAAHEHHMKMDLSGYPKSLRPRTLSIYSKIVAVADGFDAATSRRSYQTTPLQPDEVLREMWENPRRGYDRILVKALINLVGIYPVGTCVILDTYEVAIVHSANSDLSQIHRPVVRVLIGADGRRVDHGPLVNLADVDETGNFRRSIIKVTDPAKWQITPGDHFV
ncbi:MAG TPA: HD domain-containing phosphohydrolase [Gemmatimonadales bacterium]|nr:HD domain-containing phosphohydrolase [Gemmatimonadales bacterium]